MCNIDYSSVTFFHASSSWTKFRSDSYSLYHSIPTMVSWT